MDKLLFETDPALDAQFPARRICRVQIETTDGRVLLSEECEPRGEAREGIRYSWLADKFRRITGQVMTARGQEALIEMIGSARDIPLRQIVHAANDPGCQLGV